MKNIFTLFIFTLLTTHLVAQAEGSLDASFGSSGVSKTLMDGGTAQSLAIQTDGKIILSGKRDNRDGSYTSNYFLIRYNSNGSVDNTFGVFGKVFTTFLCDGLNEIAIQPDGKILLAGQKKNDLASKGQFVLARYNSNGTLDNTFATNGVHIIDWGDTWAEASCLVLQNDGKIIVGGRTKLSSAVLYRFSMARFNSNGTLDITFGTFGKTVTPVGTCNPIVGSMKLQSDGKILLMGRDCQQDFTIARFNTTGMLDNTFGVNGIVKTELFSSTNPSSMIVQPNGKIVVGGTFNNGVDQFILIRYNTNGTLDNAFGADGNGMIAVDASGLGRTSILNALTLLPNGKIIASGYAANVSGIITLIVQRYNANGTLDNTFGTNSRLFIPYFDSNSQRQRCIATCNQLQLDGKLVIGSYFYSFENGVFFGNGVSVNRVHVNCTYTLGSNSQNVAASGGTNSVALTTSSGCNWAASSSCNWVTLSSNSGTGSGSIGYSVAPNTTTSSRTCTITVEGQVFTISQEGFIPQCNTLVPTILITNCDLRVTEQANCNYQWKWNGSIVGTNSRFFTANRAGVYNCYVTLINDQTCTKSSPDLYVNYNNNNGSCITPTKEIEGFNALQVFPNPSQGQFWASFELSTVKNVTIECYNSIGQQIYKSGKGKIIGTFESEIDLPKTQSGVYWLTIILDGEKVYKPIVIKN